MWLTKRWCAWPVEPAIASFWGLSLGPRCGPWLVASHILGSRYCADCTVPRPHGGPMDSHQRPQGMRSIFSWRRLWSQLIVCGTTGFNGKAQPAISWQLEAGNEWEFRKPQTSSFSGSAGIYIYVCVCYIYIYASWWYFIFVPLILCTIFRSQFRSKMQMLHFKRTWPMIGKTHC